MLIKVEGAKAFTGHRGRPGKRGGSLPKGAGTAKPGKYGKLTTVEKVAGTAAGIAGATLGSYHGMDVGTRLGHETMGTLIGTYLGAAIGVRTGVGAVRVTKLAAAKLKTLLAKRKKAKKQQQAITDDEAADGIIEMLIAVLENYEPEGE